MLEIWLMWNIHQNIIIFNKCKVHMATLFLNHNRVYVTNRRHGIHEKYLSSNNRECIVQDDEKLNGSFIKSMLLSLFNLITRHLWAHVQIGNGRWELSSSHNPFNSIKYSITDLESCFRLLMVERKVKILTRSTFENRLCKLFQASNAWSW